MYLTAIRFLLGGSVFLLLTAGPWWYYCHRYWATRNFQVVRPGVLYRSGQMTVDGLKQVLHDYRIKTVVTFRSARGEEEPHPDAAEEEYCRSHGIRYFRVPSLGGWSGKKLDARARKVCNILADPKYQPVLVHCFAGRHRTGAYCAIYRMECEDWQNEDAIVEMEKCGYYNIDEHKDLLGYLKRYRRGQIQRSRAPSRGKNRGQKSASRDRRWTPTSHP